MLLGDILLISSVSALPPSPEFSQTIAVAQKTGQVWVALPDQNAVAVLGSDGRGVTTHKIEGCTKPSSVIAFTKGAFITCFTSSSLHLMNNAGKQRHRLKLPHGSLPVASVSHQDAVYVLNYGQKEIREIEVSWNGLSPKRQWKLPFFARALTRHRKTLMTASFFHTGATNFLKVRLHAQKTTAEKVSDVKTPRGDKWLFNQVFQIIPQAQQPLFLLQSANRGAPKKSQHAKSNLASLVVNQSKEVMLKEMLTLPSSALIIKNNLYISYLGNQRVNIYNRETLDKKGSIKTCFGPRGLAYFKRKLFVHCFTDRKIQIIHMNDKYLPIKGTRTLKLTRRDSFSAQQKKGQIIFYNAADKRMSRFGNISCGTCHFEGLDDGLTWDFSHLGEGLRNTIPLLGRGQMKHGPVHWTGNFNEIQDFEHDIRNSFLGTGFLSTDDWKNEHPQGKPKKGRSPELDALARYFDTFKTFLPSPYRKADGFMTDNAIRGKAIFHSAGCDDCHSGPPRTNSPSGIREKVGTFVKTSGKRLGRPYDGFDTPTILGLWHSAPYLHNGKAENLRQVFYYGQPINGHEYFQILKKRERKQVLRFQLEADGYPSAPHLLELVETFQGRTKVKINTKTTFTLRVLPEQNLYHGWIYLQHPATFKVISDPCQSAAYTPRFISQKHSTTKALWGRFELKIEGKCPGGFELAFKRKK